LKKSVLVDVGKKKDNPDVGVRETWTSVDKSQELFERHCEREGRKNVKLVEGWGKNVSRNQWR